MIRLECTTGGSNKYYELLLHQEGDRFMVIGYYGAIGASPQSTVIYEGTDIDAANQALEKRMQQKLKKGYVKVTANQP